VDGIDGLLALDFVAARSVLFCAAAGLVGATRAHDRLSVWPADNLGVVLRRDDPPVRGKKKSCWPLLIVAFIQALDVGRRIVA